MWMSVNYAYTTALKSVWTPLDLTLATVTLVMNWMETSSLAIVRHCMKFMACAQRSWDLLLYIFRLYFSFADVNECEEDIHNCSQICVDIPGFYTCDCNTGYNISTDEHSCNGMWCDYTLILFILSDHFTCTGRCERMWSRYLQLFSNLCKHHRILHMWMCRWLSAWSQWTELQWWVHAYLLSMINSSSLLVYW